ncbi:MAG: DUF4097 domain-containing protein [Clostridiales bacterium]|jgi:hypothetical protein|nr:DUF4097 family beta strand repeat-containing protein [Bacillota bacterium]NLK03593.1 DUF4097 domain-containing protein [Clostridiales bacterium]
MNTFQKIIKYVAMSFAIILTLIILTGIVGVVSSLASFSNDWEEDGVDFSRVFMDIESLDLRNSVGKLRVKLGSDFRVEATNVSKRFRAEEKDGTLFIEESYSKGFLWFNIGKPNKNAIITVYVPADFMAKSIKIDGGVGEVNLEDLTTDYLYINAGVGNLHGRNLYAKKVDIDGGVGDTRFEDVDFTDVNFDGGVGNASIEGSMYGNLEFDCGVGSTYVKVDGARKDYLLRIDGGLGRIRVNGHKVSGKYNDYYEADNTIIIDGGVGNVDIEFSY